ncbi:hypothetical protein ACET3Z_023290 [Daucus carota]
MSMAGWQFGCTVSKFKNCEVAVTKSYLSPHRNLDLKKDTLDLLLWDITFSNKIQKTSSVQDGDGCGDVNGQCLWEMDFRNQNTGWNDQTVKKEGDPVCNDLPNKEKGIDKVDLLPDRHTLHNKTRLAGPHDQRCCWNRSTYQHNRSRTSLRYLDQ